MTVAPHVTPTAGPVVRYTSCRIPTATATAERAGLLAGLAPVTGGAFTPLRDLDPEQAEHHHQVHDTALFREGGNIPPLWTRARGARTRLIGLTWIEEGQAIVTRTDAGIAGPGDLRGRRVAVPAARRREPQLARPVAMHGFTGALALAGLTLDDVHLVEVDSGAGDLRDFWRRQRLLPAQPAVDAVADGRADAAYLVGPAAAEYAARLGLVVAIDLDRAGDRRYRVNLGTPRAITVDQSTLDTQPDLVVAYLARLIRAADHAAHNRAEFVAAIAAQTGAQIASVEAVYGAGAGRGDLRPRLDADLLDRYDQQKNFLLRHGFIDRDFDLYAWAAPEPLRLATESLAGAGVGPAA
ncbi:hypothetical protein V6U90_08310 [Micromonospora sp. CPCC 206060]|uniref:ABC transporter substrate-binding protein n=1 Tax=Micromonospora sp. CPCC 206060 TaxID=3122406 RepID=UPI002FF2CAD6